MPAPVTTYAPKDVTLIINDYIVPGVVTLSLEWTTPPFRMVSGIRGVTTRVRNKNTSGVLKVEVLQTSVANDLFNSLVSADLGNGQAKLIITLKDLSGRFGIQSNQGYIQIRPNVQFSNSANNRVWEIALLKIEDVDINGSGNTMASLFDMASQKANQVIDSVVGSVTDLF